MDITNLQAQIDGYKAAIVTNETDLATNQAALAEAEAEMADAALVNSLEALTADQVTKLNGFLAADGSANALGLSLAITPVTQ